MEQKVEREKEKMEEGEDNEEEEQEYSMTVLRTALWESGEEVVSIFISLK